MSLPKALTCVSDLHRMRIGEPTGKAGSRRNLENGKGHKLRARLVNGLQCTEYLAVQGWASLRPSIGVGWRSIQTLKQAKSVEALLLFISARAWDVLAEYTEQPYHRVRMRY